MTTLQVKATVSGLAPGSVCFFRVRPVAKAGKVAFTQVVSLLVACVGESDADMGRTAANSARATRTWEGRPPNSGEGPRDSFERRRCSGGSFPGFGSTLHDVGSSNEDRGAAECL